MTPFRRALIATVAVLASGCAIEEKSRADFERHNNSILRTSYQDPAILVFEARAGAAYPPDSETAEALRIEWLDIRGLCGNGYEITQREAIPLDQPNFHDMDLRYLVRCADQSAEPEKEG